MDASNPGYPTHAPPQGGATVAEAQLLLPPPGIQQLMAVAATAAAAAPLPLHIPIPVPDGSAAAVAAAAAAASAAAAAAAAGTPLLLAPAAVPTLLVAAAPSDSSDAASAAVAAAVAAAAAQHAQLAQQQQQQQALKRGRVSTGSLDDDEDDDDDNDNNKSTTLAHVPGQPQAQQSRPPGSAGDVQPRKRGRPRKVETAPASDQPKKKRGRPRKSYPVSEDFEPRRSSRPRKSVELTNLGDPNAVLSKDENESEGTVTSFEDDDALDRDHSSDDDFRRNASGYQKKKTGRRTRRLFTPRSKPASSHATPGGSTANETEAAAAAAMVNLASSNNAAPHSPSQPWLLTGGAAPGTQPSGSTVNLPGPAIGPAGDGSGGESYLRLPTLTGTPSAAAASAGASAAPSSEQKSSSLQPASKCTLCWKRVTLQYLHPDLRVAICKECRNLLMTETHTVGPDGYHYVCTWCRLGGDMVCCSNCPRIYCDNCINKNFPPTEFKRIQGLETWKCYVCDPTPIAPLIAEAAELRVPLRPGSTASEARPVAPKRTSEPAPASAAGGAGAEEGAGAGAGGEEEEEDEEDDGASDANGGDAGAATGEAGAAGSATDANGQPVAARKRGRPAKKKPAPRVPAGETMTPA